MPEQQLYNALSIHPVSTYVFDLFSVIHVAIVSHQCEATSIRIRFIHTFEYNILEVLDGHICADTTKTIEMAID